MCLLVTRAPLSSLASASLHELDRLCEIFCQLQHKSHIAASTLVSVMCGIVTALLSVLYVIGSRTEDAVSGSRGCRQTRATRQIKPGFHRIGSHWRQDSSDLQGRVYTVVEYI